MITKANMTQLPHILSIYESARRFMAENGNPNQWGTTEPPEERVRQDIQEEKCYIYTDVDDIRAVFYFAIEQDPTYNYIDGAWLNDKTYGVIHRIAVGQKGKGIAAECFRFALSECDNLRIDTHENNLPMQRCLDRNGFSRCGIIYLEDGDPRIAYQKEKE